MTPGSNLLASALAVIQPQPVEFFKALGTATNAQYRTIVTYAEPRTLWGSFQPMSSARVMQLGLAATKSYFAFYASEDFASASREGPSDVFVYGGRRYEAVYVDGWIKQDGWDSVVCVDVGPANGD